MSIDFKAINAKAESYADDMTKFMCDLIALPSESCNEKEVIYRIKEEMEKVGFDKIDIDPMGNILGYIGHGKHLIAMDAHIDTVGVGEIRNWTVTGPFEPKVVGDEIYGRGGSDQEGGMVSMVYAGKIIKDLGLEDDYTLVVVGSVQEDEIKKHSHRYSSPLGWTNKKSDQMMMGTWATFNQSFDTTQCCGEETRPKNIYVNWIIKAKNILSRTP